MPTETGWLFEAEAGSRSLRGREDGGDGDGGGGGGVKFGGEYIERSADDGMRHEIFNE
jgi:hypothetical protein